MVGNVLARVVAVIAEEATSPRAPTTCWRAARVGENCTPPERHVLAPTSDRDEWLAEYEDT
jgi:hypothetical protein